MLGSGCRLEGDAEVGSLPATYLPRAICANCVDQRMLGTVCPSRVGQRRRWHRSRLVLDVRQDCSTQNEGRMHEW